MKNDILIEKCIKTLEDSKAHDLVCIDVEKHSAIADKMVICTGTSNRHVVAIAQRLEDTLYKEGLKGITLSGQQVGEWVIVDTGSVMIHVLQEEARQRYELDDLYRCMAAGVEE